MIKQFSIPTELTAELLNTLVEKIGFDSVISICPAKKLNFIITDSEASEDDLLQFEESGIKIKIAD